MKITELKCIACNGPLKISPDDPNVAVCEYCKSKYVVEYEDNEQMHMKENVTEDWYKPRMAVPPVTAPKKTGWEPYGWKRGLALAVLGGVILGGLSWKGITGRMEFDRQQKEAAVTESKAAAGKKEAEQKKTIVAAEPFDGMLEEFVETLFGKPQEDITEEELASIKWLEVNPNLQSGKIGYSFESPYDNQEAVLTVMTLSTKSIAPQQAYRFSGLEKLSIPSPITAKFKDLNLKSLSSRDESLANVKENLKNADQLEELIIWSNIGSIEGLSAFPKLNSFSLRTDQAVDLAPLAQAKGLTELSLRCNEISDYSVISTLTNLTSLSIQSENLRDIGFVSSLAGLQKLEVRDATLIHMDGLNGLTALTSLTIDNCKETQNLSGVEGLGNLETLWLEIPYGCSEPNLNGLTKLNSLYLRNMKNLNFLSSVTGLKALTLYGCEIGNPQIFSGLSQLEELKCSHLSGELGGWSFATKLPALKNLDLSAVATYEDMSGLFGIPTLQSLVLNGVECEIRFDKLSANESLKNLEMSGVKLYTNVEIQGGGGFYSIDYDKVNLDEHTDFLANYPNLESLNVSKNKLTKLDSVSGLMHLKEVDISDNFITDLKPFTGLMELELLNTTGNPVENYLILPEDVTVIK